LDTKDFGIDLINFTKVTFYLWKDISFAGARSEDFQLVVKKPTDELRNRRQNSKI
jgi:hypothetical protein